MTPRHFLDLDGIEAGTLKDILARGRDFKRGAAGHPARPLTGRTLAMIFEKPSTRTRFSFELAMKQLGGDVIVTNQNDLQLGKSETIADTARVLSRYVDAIMLRTSGHDRLLELADAAAIPVINGLTNHSHPCQVMADLLTLEERRGALPGAVVAWCGDGNNVATSWIHAAPAFGVELRLSCPAGYKPDTKAVAWAIERGGKVRLVEDPREAVRGADCVMTDTWVSMHNAGEGEEARRRAMMPYQVDSKLMALAAPHAIFMHCLPGHRGQEVTADVMDGPQSAVWDQAENRLHAQKGVLAWCLE